MLKKQFGAGAYFNCVAAVLGVVGVIAMLVSSNINAAYAYKNVALLTVMGICGVLLCIIAVWSPTKFGNHDVISTISVIGAVALYMGVVGSMIAERILMIAGLFSYNSQNTVGWNVFYATVAAAAAFVVASVIIVVGAFLGSVKNKA